MKKKEKTDLSSKNEKDLKEELVKLRDASRKALVERHSGKTKNSNEFGQYKNKIARILTILNQNKGGK